MREAIHEILTDVSDSFSNMIDMALANEIRVCSFCICVYFIVCSAVLCVYNFAYRLRCCFA